MGHRLTLGDTVRWHGKVRSVYQQARCSCGWAGPCQVHAPEALADAKVHAAIHDAVVPEIPAP